MFAALSKYPKALVCLGGRCAGGCACVNRLLSWRASFLAEGNLPALFLSSMKHYRQTRDEHLPQSGWWVARLLLLPLRGTPERMYVRDATHEILRKLVPIEVNVAEPVESSHVVFHGCKLVELHRLRVVCISSFPLEIHSLLKGEDLGWSHTTLKRVLFRKPAKNTRLDSATTTLGHRNSTVDRGDPTQ